MSDQSQKPQVQLNSIEIGVGTWAWGDRFLWGYGQSYGDEDLLAAFQASLQAGVNLFDTAEVYGQGKSEESLGRFLQESGNGTTAFLATKYMPYPWRLTRASLLRALKGSLSRLKVNCVDLYQIHAPYPPVTIETWMEAMGEAVQSGMVKAVGISNFNASQTQRAYDALIQQGIRLEANQVEYSLLNRSIERNGTFQLCKDLGVRIIAYSPLAMGLLSGKYSPENPPKGIRSRMYNRNRIQEIQPLIALMKKISAAHDGKTPAQVALNWTICKGTLPIPGAKNEKQAFQNAGATGWRLSESEVAELDDMSSRLSPSK